MNAHTTADIEPSDIEIAHTVNSAVLSILRSLPRGRRSECAQCVLALGYELTRGMEGNKFMNDWAEAALSDLAGNPPRVVMTERH